MSGSITLTFGDCAENHRGMQLIGEKSSSGYSLSTLKKIKQHFEINHGCECQIVRLHDLIDEEVESAYLLIVNNALTVDESNELFNEMVNLEWDTKALMYGRVVNKKARWNLCFSDINQEPDYKNGKGRIVSINDLPNLLSLYEYLKLIIGDEDELYVEGNYYYDIEKCGIGYHGDTERRRVIGVRLGEEIPLCFNWFHNSLPVGEKFNITLKPGDLYVMSDKAVGTDWKCRSKYTLRHSAGCKKFTDL